MLFHKHQSQYSKDLDVVLIDPRDTMDIQS